MSLDSNADIMNAGATGATGATGFIINENLGHTTPATDVLPVLPAGDDLLAMAVDPTTEAFAAQGIATEGPPSVDECPCWRCYLGWWQDGTRRRRPGVFRHDAGREGQKKAPPKLLSTWVCGPLLVEAQTSDRHGSSFGRLLRFRDSLGHWHTWNMPMPMLRGYGEELRSELLRQGLEMDPNAAKLLLAYLSDRAPQRHILAALELGWHQDTFVLPNERIGKIEIAYQSDAISNADFDQQGTLEDWRERVSLMAINNTALTLAISSAFAGPLMRLIHIESCGLHLYGRSSGGKTTALQAGVSVWGSPAMLRTWRATANGLEAAAAESNDTLLVLDELAEANGREIGAIVYELANGRGKARANRNGGVRRIARWRTVVLSSGETTLETRMDEAGAQHRAGQDVRLLNVRADERAYGTFDELHGWASPRAFADDIKAATSRFYGTAGRAFVRFLIDHLGDDVGAHHQVIMQRMPAKHGQEARAARQFALIGLAGERATQAGITGWPAGWATRTAIAAYEDWIAARGQGNAETVKILHGVRDYLLSYGSSRFSRRPNSDGYSPDADKPIQNRAGYTETTGDSRTCFLIFPAALKEATKGHDFSTVLRELDQAHWLIKSSSNQKRRQLKIQGDNVPVYQILLPNWPTDDDIT